MPDIFRKISDLALAAVVAVAVLAVPAMADGIAPADTRAVQSVIGDQIAAFRAHDDERAYSFAAPGIKRLFPTVERFMEMVRRGYQPVYDPRAYDFGRNLVQDGEVHQEVIVTDRDGKQWQAVYTLQRQPDGTWKITGVKLNPSKGLSV